MATHGINERVQKLRKQSVETPAKIDLERAKIETEVYKKYLGTVSTPVLRALVLKEYFKKKTLYIGEGELIVGEKGCSPQSAPTFPELCCHSIEDMEVMRNRDLISFCVSDNDMEVQKNVIIPFWKEKSLRNKIIENMTQEWKNSYESGIFTEFMEQRGPGHTVCDDKIYRKGFLDFKDEISQAIANLDFIGDPEAFSKKEQLEAMSITCDAVMILGERYSNYASELAEKELDPIRKNELMQISNNCKIVPSQKPTTFWQAIQQYWFVHITVTAELNPWDAYSPGRLDQHLNPFFENDVECGILDSDKALELLECLWVKFNNQPAPPKVGITLKESSTYTDFVNINTGGIAKDGTNGVNSVSYLILECMDDMKLLQPSSNVQISRKTPDKFLHSACEISRKGWGQPAFYNTEAIVQELINSGKTLEDARCGGSSGCVEVGAFGKESYILTGYFNLPKIFELTLNNGYDTVSQKQLGLKLGFGTDFSSYDELWEAYKKQIDHFLKIKIHGNNVIERIYSKYMPVPFLSVITDDCIAEGKDYNSGGARYNVTYIQGVGIGTISDCLAAIKYNVYDNKKISMHEIMRAIEANFVGFEQILNLLKNKSPKYGNDDDYADYLMVDVFEYYRNAVKKYKNTKGGNYSVNMLPTTCHVYFGEVMTASANGRLAKKPVSEGISPEKGADVNGPTAVIKSASKMDHLTTGGTLLNQKFTPDTLKGQMGLIHMGNLVKSYFTMDGHHIQFNVIDAKTLREAQKNPNEYKDLIVRVAGYSDHFRNLSKELQDEIIERTEQKFS